MGRVELLSRLRGDLNYVMLWRMGFSMKFLLKKGHSGEVALPVEK